jgi:hypothetical protein
VALAFGSAPAAARRVYVASSGGGQAAATVTHPPRETLFVAPIAASQTAMAATAYGAGAQLLEACNARRCVAP